jgi:hypothetical protein
VIRVLKYGGIAVACGVIAVLSSLILFFCSTWFVDMPLARTMALTALSLCGSGLAALIDFPDRHRQIDPLLSWQPLNLIVEARTPINQAGADPNNLRINNG